MARMKRLQISLDHELNLILGAEARRAGISKAEFVRRSLRAAIKPLPPIEEDPLFKLFGTGSSDPTDTRSIDDVVYGPSSSKRNE